jgi:hypothetical protein
MIVKLEYPESVHLLVVICSVSGVGAQPPTSTTVTPLRSLVLLTTGSPFTSRVRRPAALFV